MPAHSLKNQVLNTGVHGAENNFAHNTSNLMKKLRGNGALTIECFLDKPA